MELNFDPVVHPFQLGPLTVEEVMRCLRSRWNATYDLQLVVRQKRLYLQMMWAYLEQQSFPLDEESYKIHLNEILEIINRLGLSDFVREWLATTPRKPRLGRAISLPLNADGLLGEFVL